MFRLTVLLITLGAACGAPTLKSPGIDGRIVGGHNTTIDLYPWQLSLQISGSHLCGAVLISPNWALTAAHCVQNVIVSHLSIRAGSTNRSSGGQLISVSKVFIHDNFNNDVNNNNDIAALELEASVNVTTAKAATLPAAGADVAAGTNLNITGWGSMSEYGERPHILQAVEVPVVSRAQCISIYSENKVTNNMICAGDLEKGGKDSCQGDSGGPATVNDVLVGTVSWGTGCGRPNNPGVYTRVAQYTDWIKQTTGV